jgi:hypothetical protein
MIDDLAGVGTQPEPDEEIDDINEDGQGDVNEASVIAELIDELAKFDIILPDDTNEWVRAGLQLVGGMAGGVAAANTLRGGRALNAAGDADAMRTAAPEAFEAGRGRYDDAMFPRQPVAGGALRDAR